MAEHVQYWAYDPASTLTCPACKWEGRADAGSIEHHQELFDVSCPECDRMLLIVPFPTAEETRRAAAEGHPGALKELPRLEKIEQRQERAESSELTEDSPLPELTGRKLEFLWDFEEVDGDSWTVISCDGRPVWRELAYYEGWQRFIKVRALLKHHYEPFRSLTPTSASLVYLYGDDLSAPAKIAAGQPDP